MENRIPLAGVKGPQAPSTTLARMPIKMTIGKRTAMFTISDVYMSGWMAVKTSGVIAQQYPEVKLGL
jgi:hypothetical protein